MAITASELQTIPFAKKLTSYTFTITKNAPKQFRFSLIGRMQGYALDIVEELYCANNSFVQIGVPNGWPQRQSYQRKAMSTLKLLVYAAQLSMGRGRSSPNSI